MSSNENSQPETLYVIMDFLDSENDDLFHNVDNARSYILKKIQELEMKEWNL